MKRCCGLFLPSFVTTCPLCRQYLSQTSKKTWEAIEQRDQRENRDRLISSLLRRGDATTANTFEILCGGYDQKTHRPLEEPDGPYPLQRQRVREVHDECRMFFRMVARLVRFSSRDLDRFLAQRLPEDGRIEVIEEAGRDLLDILCSQFPPPPSPPPVPPPAAPRPWINPDDVRWEGDE